MPTPIPAELPDEVSSRYVGDAGGGSSLPALDRLAVDSVSNPAHLRQNRNAYRSKLCKCKRYMHVFLQLGCTSTTLSTYFADCLCPVVHVRVVPCLASLKNEHVALLWGRFNNVNGRRMSCNNKSLS